MSKDNVLSLDNILAKPVANSNPAPVIGDDAPFEEIDEAVIDPAPPEPEPQPQPGADAGYMPYRDIAEMLVNLVDGLQSSLVPYMREKKVFTERELETLQRLDTTNKTVYPPNSPEEAILRKWNRHKRICEDIPFDEGELRRLTNATERYAKTVDLKVTPLGGLLASFSEVLVKRTTLFFKD